MRHYRSPLNPAGTAIAAVLALAPLGAIAQTADPAAQPVPPVVAQPAPPSVAAPPPALPSESSPVANAPAPQPVFAPSNPVVQQIPTETDPLPAQMETQQPIREIAPTSKSKAQNMTPAKPVAAAPPSDKTASRATPADKAASPANSNEAAWEESVAPSASDPALSNPNIPQEAASQPEPSAQSGLETRSEDTALWALGLGALALVGGAGLFAARRRGARMYARDSAEVSMAPPRVQPLATNSFNMVDMNEVDNDMSMKDLAAMHGFDPIADEVSGENDLIIGMPKKGVGLVSARTSAFPQWDAAHVDLAARREALIAQTPSVDNPFLTRKNRRRRATFILRQQALASSEPQNAQVQQADETVRQAYRPVQISYRYGGSQRPTSIFKPKFN